MIGQVIAGVLLLGGSYYGWKNREMIADTLGVELPAAATAQRTREPAPRGVSNITWAEERTPRTVDGDRYDVQPQPRQTRGYVTWEQSRASRSSAPTAERITK